jgi:outer membrane protein TolC
MNKIFYLIFFLWLPFSLVAQDTQALSLSDVIVLSQKNSVLAIKARHQYLVAYWQYRYFQADYLPYVSLNTTPINFNRTVTQRFDVNQNIDVYLPQRNIHSSANVSLYQRIGLTGGSIFIDSDISRLQNFGNNPFTTYSVTPFRIGMIQPLFAFNEQKWEKVLKPLAFDLANKTYIFNMEEIAQQATLLFFDLLNAQNDYQQALSNVTMTRNLLQIAKERKTLGTLTLDDVLELELRLLSEQGSLENTTISTLKAESRLKAFLGLRPGENVSLILPEELIEIQIEDDLALELALKNQPEIIRGRYEKISADREADKTTKENRFNAEVQASIGLNQSNENAFSALKDLFSQEQVRISLNIPILDWGRREGRAKMAQSQREVIYSEVAQQQIDFEQEVKIQIANYLTRPALVRNAKKIKELASKRLQITRQRFLQGSVDLLKLTSAIQARDLAQKEYLKALENFWISYFEVRKLTLHDFSQNRSIEIEYRDFLQ